MYAYVLVSLKRLIEMKNCLGIILKTLIIQLLVIKIFFYLTNTTYP